MKINKKSLFITSIITICSLFSIGGAVFGTTLALSSIGSTYEECVVDGHKYKFYKISGENSVAIAWAFEDNNPVPSTLNIPSSVTLGETPYTVKAIYKGGFRTCTFTEVNLPTTIEAIGEEAFAYCENITEFSIPHAVSEIAPSTFMDCRNMEVLYYTKYNESTGKDDKYLGNSVITSIGDHAFDSCVSLRGFYCPTTVTYFGESCFQNCQNIQSLYFPSSNGMPETATPDNGTNLEDGDYYLDRALSNHATGTADGETAYYIPGLNRITVKSYAFADCPYLLSVYFETNMLEIEDYAFADCKSELTFSYTGNSIPSFATHWRDKNITTSNNNVYDISINQTEVEQNDSYPGLTYIIRTSPIYLDSSGIDDPKQSDNLVELAASSTFVEIRDFTEPFATQPGYYNIVSKTLTIPNVIENHPVKVIGKSAFVKATSLKSVIFNSNLVQIKHRAFYGCNVIESLNFNACTNLKEISYEIFQAPANTTPSSLEPTNSSIVNEQKYNTSLTTLAIPNSVEYIGDSAFYNFKNLTGGITFKGTNPAAPSNLKVIGDYAFAVHRRQKWTPSSFITLELPNSLDDRYVKGGTYTINGNTVNIKASKYYHPYYPWLPDSSRQRRYAVGRFAFDNARTIGAVIMEEATASQIADSSHTTSFMSNAFVRCYYLRKFVSNYNLFLIGMNAFKDVPNLREVFLHSEKAAANSNVKFPWGLDDNMAIDIALNNNSIKEYGAFRWQAKGNEDGGSDNNYQPDIVFYVSGSSAPGDLDDISKYKAGTCKWNSTNLGRTLQTDLQYNTDLGKINNRAEVPTFYNAVWEGNNKNIYYWKPGEASLKGSMMSFSDYDNGYISIFKASNSNYSIGKYYSDGASGHVSDEVDLTAIPSDPSSNSISNNLKKIASGAFASEKGKNLGYYFVLPTTIETIGDRAFFRIGSNSCGVRVVTYKSGNDKVKPANETNAYSVFADSWGTTVNGVTIDYGYCCLPNSVTRIERNAFYNNAFKRIVIGNSLAFLGVSAFHVHNQTSKIVEFSGAQTGSAFTVTNDGIYYTGAAGKKMLVYQADGTATTLTIANDTKAIGMRALAKSNWKIVTLNSGLTTIYGQAFQGNATLTEVNGDGLSSLEYICAIALDVNDEIYQSTYPFENYDTALVTGTNNLSLMKAYARFGAFKDCTNLKTVNFKAMTNLIKIGLEAFKNCSSLDTMTGGDSYTFYDYTGKTLSQSAAVTTTNTGVLDLRGCSQLKSITKDAFNGCSLIKYALLPNTLGVGKEDSLDLESNFYFGTDKEYNYGNGKPFPDKTTKILIGESWKQAQINVGALNHGNHYPSGALSGNDYTYYRYFYKAGDSFNSDYVYSGSDNSAVNNSRYWEIYDGDIFLFKGKSQVEAFWNRVHSGTWTKGNRLDGQ